MYERKWRTMEDCNIRHIWKDDAGEEHDVSPSYYEENGEPCNDESGKVMEYVRTEVFI